MKRLITLALLAFGPLSAHAQEQFQIEFKLYRTTVPIESSASAEDSSAAETKTGIIEGDYVNEEFGFSEEDGQLVYRTAESEVERKYELISAPQVLSLQGEEATIHIGEEVPYSDVEEDEDGNPVMVTKHKPVGTQINVVISESNETNVTMNTDGSFTAVVDKAAAPAVDEHGNRYDLPILQTVEWSNHSVVPLGAWHYQRIQAGRNHEFLIFARTTRFEAEKEASSKQYSVEMKLVRLPESLAETLREEFVHEEAALIDSDTVKVLRARDATSESDVDATFDAIFSDEQAELITAPRITVGTGNTLFKLVIRNVQPPEGGVVSSSDNKGVPGVEHFMDYSPIAGKFLQKGGPNLGVISDANFLKDPSGDSVLGFEGHQIGVQIDPSADSSDEQFGFNLMFHHQFKTAGRERSLFRRAEPYTFDDQVFHLSDFPVADGESFGLEFVSKKTGDLMFMFVTLDLLNVSGPRFFDSEAPASTAPTAGPPNPIAFSSSSIAIPDGVESVFDIVPQIDGEYVRLQIQYTGIADRVVAWTNVIARDQERIVIGFDFDNPDELARPIETDRGGASSESVLANSADHRMVVPEDVDLALGITPQIARDQVRLWFEYVDRSIADRNAVDRGTWTNVIVNTGDGLILGRRADGSTKLLDIREAASNMRTGPNPYSVEFTVLRIAAEHADAVRETISYIDSIEPVFGNARAFRAVVEGQNPEDRFLQTLKTFQASLKEFNPELVTAPRIVVRNRPPKEFAAVDKPSILDQMVELSPRMKPYLQPGQSYVGSIGDLATHTIPTHDPTAPIVGFDGVTVSLRLKPSPANDSRLRCDFVFHQQFLTGAIPDEERKKAIKGYTFGNDIHEFHDVPIRDGGWIGFEYESSVNGDLMLLLMSVVNVDPSQ